MSWGVLSKVLHEEAPNAVRFIYQLLPKWFPFLIPKKKKNVPLSQVKYRGSPMFFCWYSSSFTMIFALQFMAGCCAPFLLPFSYDNFYWVPFGSYSIYAILERSKIEISLPLPSDKGIKCTSLGIVHYLESPPPPPPSPPWFMSSKTLESL